MKRELKRSPGLALLTLLSLVFFLKPVGAWAVDEKQFATMIKKVAEFYDQVGRPCDFSGVAAMKLVCREFQNAHAIATIVVVEGYSESMRQYEELAFDLYKAGYTVFLYDHRGQGGSTRFLDDPRKASIDEFDHFADDLTLLIDQKIRPSTSGHVFLLAHSMGGAIATRYLELGSRVDAAVLMSPMLKMNLHGWPEWIAQGLLWIESFFGQDGEFVDEGRDPLLDRFEQNEVTQSRSRYEARQAILAADPHLRIFGHIKRWVRKAIAGTRLARAEAAKIHTPVLLLQAGFDSFVEPAAQVDLCHEAPECKLVMIPKAKHEILQETDAIRDPALGMILQFFKEQAAH